MLPRTRRMRIVRRTYCLPPITEASLYQRYCCRFRTLYSNCVHGLLGFVQDFSNLHDIGLENDAEVSHTLKIP